MRRSTASVALSLACTFLWTAAARAQGGRGADWMTAGGDAERTASLRNDPKISVARMQKPGFQVAWKIKLKSEPSEAATLDRYIGYRGFRSFALVGSPAGDITAFDTDLGRIEWTEQIPGGAGADAATPCSGAMTSNVTRPTIVAIPAPPAGRGAAAPPRSNFAKGAVGAPDQGAVIIAEMAARAAATAGRGAAPVPPPPPPPAAPGAAAVYNPFAARAAFLQVISGNGLLHSMYISNGEEPAPPIAFLPAHANAHGLAVVNNVAYAATSGGCGGAPNGIWALDLISKEVVHWSPTGGDIAGKAGFAFGPDSVIYATTTDAELVALSLQPKAFHVNARFIVEDPSTAENHSHQPFVTSPVVFDFDRSTMVAAATADGRLHLVAVNPVTSTWLDAGIAPGALSAWQDAAGTHWLAAPTKSSIAAWKVAQRNGSPVLQPGWTSREMASPLSPIVINGVAFAVSNSSPPVLYALDAATGKELWNSGKELSAPIRVGSLSAIGGQVYLGASDGTFYAFGFPIEH